MTALIPPNDGSLPHNDGGQKLESGDFFTSPRTFQFEASGPPHGWFIIRSPKMPTYHSRIDLMFLDLQYLSSRASFVGIKISRIEPETSEDKDLLGRARIDRYRDSSVVFRIESMVEGIPTTGYAIAGNLYIYEDQIDEGFPRD